MRIHIPKIILLELYGFNWSEEAEFKKMSDCFTRCQRINLNLYLYLSESG